MLANPADVSGVSNPQTSTDDSYSAEAYMAYNMYSALQKQLYSADDGWYTEFENEFYDALIMQRKYWEKRDIVYKSEDFFGYKLG